MGSQVKKTKISGEARSKKDAGSKVDAKNDEHNSNIEQNIISPVVSATRVVFATLQNTGIDKEKISLPTLVDLLRDQAEAVKRNDLTQAEAMLMNQATALQSIFVRLTEKAMAAEFMNQFDSMIKMALRAQNQCRATLETLATIKNPPVVLAKQANVSAGPQQVNNNINVTSRAEENKKTQIKLSGGKNELPPNTGTPCIESQAHPTLEAMGKVHRAKVRKGKS